MKKKILVIILGLLIVILIGYSIFYFINVNDDSNVNNDNEIVEGTIKEYGVTWNLFKQMIYYTDVDYVEVRDEIIQITVFESNIKICEDNIDNCREEKYEIDNKNIKINTSKKYKFTGNFKIFYEDIYLALEKYDNEGVKYVYYFEQLRDE